MKERLKELRKELGFSQEEFGNRLGVTKASISRLESGSNNFTDQMIKSICREFNVDYGCLTEGSGDMFRKVPEEDEVAAFVSELLEDDGDNALYTMIVEVMRTYSELDAKSQDIIKDSCRKLLDNLSKKREG